MPDPLFAAIDCGTNSTRLLIGDGTRTVERLMQITRLGAGVDATGALRDDAVDRVVATLGRYRQVMDRYELAGVRMVATSAVRDALNGDRFLDASSEVVGVAAEVLTGESEAELSFRGATAGLGTDEGPFLVVDIGGGSTEFAFGAARCEVARSIRVGCVRMTEQYLHHDPPRPEELSNCLAGLEVEISEVLREVPMIASASTVVGLAGTVSTVAAVEIGLPAYDRDRIHHFTLTRAAVEDVFRTLATESTADRIHNPGLEPERADVIVGGCCVLVAVMRGLALESVLVSESDILDGLVLAQVGSAADGGPRAGSHP